MLSGKNDPTLRSGGSLAERMKFFDSVARGEADDSAAPGRAESTPKPVRKPKKIDVPKDRTERAERTARNRFAGMSRGAPVETATLESGQSVMGARLKSMSSRRSGTKSGTKSKAFSEALNAMRSRLEGAIVRESSLEPLGLSKAHAEDPATMSGGLVLTDFPDVGAVGQGRVEVHPFRWSALGIDPKGNGEDGTTLVIRSRHWRDKIEGEGAAFKLSLMGGSTLDIDINSVQPDQHTGVVVLNLSDRELSKAVGTKIGHNLNFKVDAAFTDKERPKGRHTQHCVFSIPTEAKANVRRERIGWGAEETVDINLPRTDGVVSELQQIIPQLKSMTTMMETEAEFQLPRDFDMLSARKNIFALATNPRLARRVLGERYEIYPADKYIRKNLGRTSPQDYERMPMSHRAKFWEKGADGLPDTIGHTDTILDTPDRSLLKAGLILRVRANERGTVLSLKSVSQKGSSEHSRVRFCADASLPKGTKPEEAIEILQELLRHKGSDPLDQNPFVQGLECAGVKVGALLRPTLSVESKRDRVRIVDKKDSSNIELSLDRSIITPYSEDGSRLLIDRSVTSLGFEYGLEHAGVNPSDAHGPKPSSGKRAVQGFRGFHVPSDLEHPSLHDPRSARNRALTEIVQNLTGEVFGSVELTPGGFKAVQGAQDLGLIDGSWRKAVEQRELGLQFQDAPLSMRSADLPPHVRAVADWVEDNGKLSVAQVKNLMTGEALGSLSIVAGPKERKRLAAFINENAWLRPFLSMPHTQKQLRHYGLEL